MYCINCGTEIKSEDVYCPRCGKPLQMVPDYSIYDEDDINIILENTNDIEIHTTRPSKSKTEQDVEITSIPKKKKKMDVKKIITLTMILCVVLVGAGIGVKMYVDHQNNNSYEYQMKAGDEAFFKEKLADAESYYQRALSLSKDNASAIKVRIKLADVFIAQEKTADAIVLLNEVISLDVSENYDAYKRLFDIYKTEGNTDAILALKENITSDKILKIFEDYIVQAPIVNVPSGNYSEVIKLSISGDQGLQIFYTIDGTNPITHGSLYTNPIELSAAGMHTVKMVSMNSLGVYSDIITQTYVIKYNAPSDPEVTPNGGTFTTPSYVYINVPDGCSAYYTWDRSEPNAQSSKYVSPLLIPEGYNILSVIIINDTTGLSSGIYRGVFEYMTE